MYIGIDFGTTFSQIATNILDVPTLLLSPGEYGVPSAFYYDNVNGILIGEDAEDAGIGNDAQNIVHEVKMNLEKEYVLDGKTFKASEISKKIYEYVLKKGIKIAQNKGIDSEIEGVVISVPAKFGMQQRAIIREAARGCIEGKTLHISDIIKEPVAAALAYYKTEAENEKNVLVYDLGGGTCDIALVRSDNSLTEHFEVVDSDMEILGGRDWDSRLIDYLSGEIYKKTGKQIKGNPANEDKVRRAAIKAKQDLSDELKTRVMARIDVDGRVVAIPIARKTFDDITQDLLEKSLQCLKRVYDRNLGCIIDDVILVGGSSNMLQVQEGVRRTLPNCAVKVYEPELAVVKGTAIYADMLKGTSVSTVLQDKCNFSYGIKLYEDFQRSDKFIIVNIIFKDKKLPSSGKEHSYTLRNNQRQVSFEIFESEYTEKFFDFDGTAKKYIGEILLDLPSGFPANTECETEMRLNNQGLLEVSSRGPNNSFIRAEFNLADLK